MCWLLIKNWNSVDKTESTEVLSESVRLTLGYNKFDFLSFGTDT